MNISGASQSKLYFKIGFILLLILLLMIPNGLIRSLIYERQGLEEQVQNEITSSWGPEQTIMGPVLSIPFVTKLKDSDEVHHHILRVLPSDILMDVNLETEERKKSIYSAILYTAHHNLTAKFTLPAASDFGTSVVEILWQDAKLDLGLTAAASLENIVQLRWDGKITKMNSGASDMGVFRSAIHCSTPLSESVTNYEMQLEFAINGSGAIKYTPCADNTKITMNGDWDAPGFIGLPLPQDRAISEDGFTANWQATEYNRPYRSMWFNSEIHLNEQESMFGVSLVDVVSHYQKNMRSCKYALLIISLSFLVFFFFEILKSNPIHAVQYIMVGLALSIFYLLLLSISEHLGFNKAYLIAASSVVLLISWYSQYLFHNLKQSMMLGILLIALYVYVFTLLQMEEFALLVGSLGLFLIMFAVMFLSRNFNWYGIRNEAD